jgi:hypothetical protein
MVSQSHSMLKGRNRFIKRDFAAFEAGNDSLHLGECLLEGEIGLYDETHERASLKYQDRRLRYMVSPL